LSQIIKNKSYLLSNFDSAAFIGLSIILTSNFYFQNFTNFEPIHFKIKFLELGILFIFSYIFFYLTRLIFNFLKIFKSQRIQKIQKILTHIFFAWMLVQLLQTFFYLSNVNSLSLFLSNNIDMIIKIEIVLLKKIFIFSLTYLISFILVFLCRDYLEKLLKLFISSSIIFIIIILYRETQINFSFNEKNITKDINYNYENKDYKKEINKDKKVIWIILDEFDPQIAFPKSGFFLDNIEQLKNKSYFHKNIYAPARQTNMSLPSMMTGVKISDLEIINKKFYLKNIKNELTHFNYKNTIFHRLEKIGLKSNVYSSVLDYCSTFLPGINSDRCKEKPKDQISIKKLLSRPFTENFKGVLFVFSLSKKLNFIQGSLAIKEIMFYDQYNLDQLNEIDLEVQSIKKINTKNFKPQINDLDGRNSVFFSDIKKSLNDDSNLNFFHLYVPHLPSEYSEKILGVEPKSFLSKYHLNLKLTDIMIGQLTNLLADQANNDVMLIISSDHWFRQRNSNFNIFYPSLLLIKILNDDSKVESAKENSLIHLHEIIYKYFVNNIRNHKDINNFFINKPHIKPCAAQACLHGKKINF